MKKAFSKILLGSILATTLTLSLCGCGGGVYVDAITFTSVQSDTPITLTVTGKTEKNPQAIKKGSGLYWDNRSREEMLLELKQNDLNYFTSHGFEFVSFPNDRGVYYLYILTTDFDGRTTIAIDDMTCQLCVNNKVVLSDYPFPLFMLETVDGEPVYQTTAYKLSFDQEYKCDGAELLDLIKTLGIWGVEEQSDGFILTYKGQSVRVIEGDGTVTLQEVHPIRPSVLTYDSRWGEEKILQEIEAGGAKVITVGGEKFVSVPQKYGYNNVYRLEITPQSKGDYNYCVTLDPMYTTLLKGSTAMCELPFPYMLLRENGEPCGVLLVFGKAYACDIDLLALIRDMGAWRIEEADGTFEMRLGSTRIQVVQKNGTVTLQQVA